MSEQIGIGREFEVPDDWSVSTIEANIADIGDGGTPDTDVSRYFGGEINWATVKDIKFSINDTDRSLTEEGLNNSSAKLWPEKSVIVTTGATIGKVGIAQEPTATKQGITGIIPNKNLDPQYLAYYLISEKETLQRYAQGGTFEEIRPYILKRLRLPLPPLTEQRRIADILSTVDEQVQQTKNILHNKQELREGLVSELIRTGLDAHESVSKRVGPKEYQIAEGWELQEVQELAIDEKKAIRGGPSGTQLKGAEYGTKGAKVYGQEHVSARDFARGDKHLAEGEFVDFQSVEILPDDVLVTMMGTVGDSAVFPSEAEKGIMDSHLLRIRPDQQAVVPDFLSLMISESKLVEDQIRSLSHGLVMRGLNIGIVESLTVPIPPINEQQRFVEILSKSSESIEVEERRLQSLKELKRGLTQDLLTGKVRVKTD